MTATKQRLGWSTVLAGRPVTWTHCVPATMRMPTLADINAQAAAVGHITTHRHSGRSARPTLSRDWSVGGN